MRLWNLNILGYMKNVDKLATIQAEESVAFAVTYMERMLDSKNNVNGNMLFELLRCLSNLSELAQHREGLVRAGILKDLSRIVQGKLVERLYWKPSERNDEFCSFEKAYAIKCLYSYAIHPKFSGAVLEDEPLITGASINHLSKCNRFKL